MIWGDGLRELAFILVSWGIFSRGDTIDFDSLKAGATPTEWTTVVTHRGEPGHWVVRADATAPSRPNVLAQMAADHNRFRFALALYDKGYCRNGDLTVNMKVISGKLDQTAGLVWRYQDANNYYMLHVSANEDKIGVYRVIDGKPMPVARLAPGEKAFQVSHRIDPLEWNVARVSFRDAHITVFFDHRKVMEADDSAILKPGKTGLWTKGDTIAYFDDFRIDKKKD